MSEMENAVSPLMVYHKYLSSIRSALQGPPSSSMSITSLYPAILSSEAIKSLDSFTLRVYSAGTKASTLHRLAPALLSMVSGDNSDHPASSAYRSRKS